MENLIEPSGILLVDKPVGMTSHDVVGAVRRLYHTRRVGHTGTLDPLATGVLAVLIGRAAKAAEYLTADEKIYEAVLRLGIATDTQDTTGTVLSAVDTLPSPEAVRDAAVSFIGEYEQLPPMYSAIKINGQKLVDLARRGIEVERETRKVTVFSLVCTPLSPSDYALTVHCSSGTYIRTLCHDIGEKLGCGGAMAALRRVRSGAFEIGDCTPLDTLRTLSDAELAAHLIPVAETFRDLPALSLSAFYEKLARAGCEIYLHKIGVSLAVGTRVRLCDAAGRFFALGEVREFEGGLAAKPVKLFEI